MLLNKRYDKEMAEEVIEQLEIAFKQLKDEATSLIKASKNNEYKENDGRVNDDFLARYFTMRKTELRHYEQLMSELRSIQDEDARTYLEEEAAYTCILTVQALMGKLNFIINGDIPPSGTATPRREASPQIYQPAQQEETLMENATSQETLFQDESIRIHIHRTATTTASMLLVRPASLVVSVSLLMHFLSQRLGLIFSMVTYSHSIGS